MSRRIRIRGVIDLVRLDEPAAISACSEDVRLDRDFAGAGPLLNRWLARRVRRHLQIDGTALPAVAPRNYPGRAERQAELEKELATRLADGGPASEHLDRLASYVRGEQAEHVLGPTAQETIGRLFSAAYQGTGETWGAACVLDAAPRTMNPFRALVWALTGAVRRSRRTLADAVAGSPAGVHATGIAVHSLVRSLQAMREVWREPGARDGLSADAAVLRSLRAPERVLRRWTAPATTVHGDIRPGVLTFFELDRARVRQPGSEMVFMTASWTRCPAHRWTATLLRQVWERAVATGAPR
jgi:hypothetical protein